MSLLTPTQTRTPLTIKPLLFLLVLSFVLLCPAQALFATSYKIVYVEPISELVEALRAPRAIPRSRTTIFNSLGRNYMAKEHVLYNSSAEGYKELPFEAESDTEKAIQRAYKHLKADAGELKDRLQHAENDLTIYLVNDSNVNYPDDMDAKERDEAFWPHASDNKKIILGAVPMKYYYNTNMKRLIAHEVTHHIDNCTWKGYGLPKGVNHTGDEIYENEETAMTEGIAMYYGKLKNPDWTIVPPKYRRAKEIIAAYEANKYKKEGEKKEKAKEYTKEELEPEELWRNESLNALILYDIAKASPLGEKRIDNIFIKTNNGGDRTLKTFLEAYLNTYPDDANAVAEAIEKYIGDDQVAKVLTEEQKRKAELQKWHYENFQKFHKLELQKREERDKCQASLDALRKELKWVDNYIIEAAAFGDFSDTTMRRIARSISLPKEIAELERKVEKHNKDIYMLDLLKNVKVTPLVDIKKSSVSINVPDLVTTSIGEQGAGAHETGQGKATVNTSEW